MSTDAYLLYELKPEVLERLQLPPLPFPVGKDRVGEIFRKDGVRFDLLLEEMDRFVEENPETTNSYRPALTRLSYVLALREGSEGRPEAAVRLLALGLRHDPTDYSLRANHAFGLHLAGRLEEAVAEYKSIVDAQPEGVDPLIRILAARACGQLGDFQEGYRLLSEGTEAFVGDEGFDRLLAGYRKKSEAAGRSVHRFCTQCGKPLKVGAKFCTGCGGIV